MTAPSQPLLDRIDRLSTVKKRMLRERLMQKSQSSHTSSGAKLIAYTTWRDMDKFDSAELREFCERKLPSYMVPQIFVPVDEMPRTAAGKIDRQALQISSWNQDGPAQTDYQELVMPRNEIEEKLAAIWSKVLGIDELSVHDNFFEVGGDSLQIIRILSHAAKDGFSIKPDVIFSHPTIAEQAQFVSLAKRDTGTAGDANLKPLLLPIQNWFFQRVATHTEQWNQSWLLSAGTDLKPDALEQAMHAVLAHHDALRARFVLGDSGWRTGQHNGELKPTMTSIDISQMSQTDQSKTITDTADTLNASFDLATPPLLGIVHFTTAPGLADFVLICAHHLIVDAESWRILLADLYSTYHARSSGKVLSLPAKTTSLIAWSNRLSTFARSAEFAPVKKFWREQMQRSVQGIPMDQGYAPQHTAASPADNLERDSTTHTVWLERSDTEQLVSALPQALRTRVHVILISALARVIANWANAGDIMIDMEGHGREPLFDDVDISRTVGWFTSVFPVLFQGQGSAWQTPVGALRIVKQSMSALPLNGLGYGLSKEYSDDESVISVLNNAQESQVLFNYLGKIDAAADSDPAFEIIDDRCGIARHADCKRAYLLEVNAAIIEQQLRVDWSYNSTLHHASTIERLAQTFIGNLQEFLSDDKTPAADAVIPTDFPLSGLDQEELDRLSQQLGDLDD